MARGYVHGDFLDMQWSPGGALTVLVTFILTTMKTVLVGLLHRDCVNIRIRDGTIDRRPGSPHHRCYAAAPSTSIPTQICWRREDDSNACHARDPTLGIRSDPRRALFPCMPPSVERKTFDGVGVRFPQTSRQAHRSMAEVPSA